MAATAFFGSALCKASSSQTIAGRMSSEPENIGNSIFGLAQGSLIAAITASSSQNSIEVMFNAFMENACSEQGARMSAMDNSSRNAGEMLDRLTLTYNRTRQAAITTELIEIISGAMALTG